MILLRFNVSSAVEPISSPPPLIMDASVQVDWEPLPFSQLIIPFLIALRPALVQLELIQLKQNAIHVKQHPVLVHPDRNLFKIL